MSIISPSLSSYHETVLIDSLLTSSHYNYSPSRQWSPFPDYRKRLHVILPRIWLLNSFFAHFMMFLKPTQSETVYIVMLSIHAMTCVLIAMLYFLDKNNCVCVCVCFFLFLFLSHSLFPLCVCIYIICIKVYQSERRILPEVSFGFSWKLKSEESGECL